MKIKNKLYLIFSIIFISVAAIGIVIYDLNNKMDMVSNEFIIASTISNNLNDLNTVTYEYLLYHEKRMLTQWNISYDSAIKLTKSVESLFAFAEEHEIIRTINSNLVSIRGLFFRLIALNEKRKKNISEGASEQKIAIISSLEARLTSQLFLKSGTAITNSLKLQHMINAEINDAQEKSDRIIILVLFLFTVISAVSLFLIYRSIFYPISTLIKGSELIGQGDLDHEIDIKSKDEIGDLAGKFGNMRVKLKASYSSLENKVRDKTSELEAERKSLEEKVKRRTAELQKTRDGLEDEVAHRTEELKLKYEELERVNKAFVGRELKMKELKKETEELKKNK